MSESASEVCMPAFDASFGLSDKNCLIVDLHGKTALEVEDAVLAGISVANTRGYEGLRIIHGFNRGEVLRKAVSSVLAALQASGRFVASFEVNPHNPGETIVRLY